MRSLPTQELLVCARIRVVWVMAAIHMFTRCETPKDEKYHEVFAPAQLLAEHHVLTLASLMPPHPLASPEITWLLTAQTSHVSHGSSPAQVSHVSHGSSEHTTRAPLIYQRYQDARWLRSAEAQHWADRANKRWLALARSEAITSRGNICSRAHTWIICPHKQAYFTQSLQVS